jgi:hypothetical protein
MENIKEQFARLYMELDLTDDQAAMIKKLQRDVDAALRQPPVIGSVCPDCLMGRDEFEPEWKCPDCRGQTDL